jgi:hypothetical protein
MVITKNIARAKYFLPALFFKNFVEKNNIRFLKIEGLY